MRGEEVSRIRIIIFGSTKSKATLTSSVTTLLSAYISHKGNRFGITMYSIQRQEATSLVMTKKSHQNIKEEPARMETPHTYKPTFSYLA